MCRDGRDQRARRRSADIGERPPYDDVFDATARRLFERRYHEDIDRLGYSF